MRTQKEGGETVTTVKKKIQHRGKSYEGLRSIYSVAMAIFESSGMRRLIDERCNYDLGKRILSPGMVVKALIGPMLDTTDKYPLYLVNEAYSAAPTDEIFGSKVTEDDLYDNALARGLDTLFDADLQKLFSECSNLITEKYDLSSYIFHIDATDVSFTGMKHAPDKEGAAIPLHNGHPKDMHYELLQYELQVATDSNRILRHMQPFSGNTPDPIMDSIMIDIIASAFTKNEREEITIIGDSKLASCENMQKMIGYGFSFVSKCSENFKDKAKKKIVELSLKSGMHPASKKGLSVGNYEFEINLSEKKKEKLRFIAFRHEAKIAAEMEKVRISAEEKSSEIAKIFVGKRFKTEAETRKAIEKVIGKKNETFTFETKVMYYDSMSPEESGWWEAKLIPIISEEGIRTDAERKSTSVLVTNLSYEKASDETVLKYYNHEYKVEHSFRLMKSGMGMNSIYLQTPSRENAMMFVISIATLISNVADAIFRKSNLVVDKKPLTMHRLAYHLMTTTVEYTRSENELWLRGPSKVTDGFFKITDTLKINPQYLMGYLEN